MPTLPRILKRTPLAHTALFRVEQLQLEFSNGAQRTFERLLGQHPAVIIVPMLDAERVILVREYAAGLNNYQLALPKGKVDAGESFEQAANRELQEEIGYGARSCTLLKALSQSPNYMQHTTQIVLAEGLYPQSAEGDEPEPLEQEIHPLSSLEALCLREDFTEARSLAALFLARHWLHSR